MSEELSREEVHQAADRAVQELLAAAGVSKPPVDAVALARQHLRLPLTSGKDQPRVAIVIRRATEEERQWAAAQAIGEHLKPDLLRRLGVAGERRPLMAQSPVTLLARRLLTPADWFTYDARACGWDVLDLKQIYKTASHEVVAWRLLDLPEPCVVTIVDNDHVSRRRSNAWRVRKELEPAERACQHYVHHYSRPRVVAENGWTVQGWPVHQPDWKREILRSVAETDGG